MFLKTYDTQDIPPRHKNVVLKTYAYVLKVYRDLSLKTYVMSWRYVLRFEPKSTLYVLKICPDTLGSWRYVVKVGIKNYMCWRYVLKNYMYWRYVLRRRQDILKIYMSWVYVLKNTYVLRIRREIFQYISSRHKKHTSVRYVLQICLEEHICLEDMSWNFQHIPSRHI